MSAAPPDSSAHDVARRPLLRLCQLPIPQSAALAPTGNVPLAAGALAVAAQVHGLTDRLRLELPAPSATDTLGDTRLIELLARGEPAYLGLSLYLWNVERSLYVAREVKKRSPRTKILIGGPEVGADNPYVLGQGGYDLAVTGEAEDLFAGLMHALLDGRDGRGLPGVSVRSALGGTPFGAHGGANFPLTQYPSPYVAGVLPVEAARSTYVETVRGCRSHCTFCFYPRSSNVLRALSIADAGALVRHLGEAGAREVVFLDPTFNHRPDFEALLDALAAANPSRRMTFFGEVRAEGLTAAHAAAMARAGFTKLELGLQSVNKRTLAKVRRGGSPDKVAAVAKLLHAEGLRLVVDLIVGLPGDTAADVLEGIDFLEAHGLGAQAQVFPLAVLPGTAMRAQAEADGLVFDPAPPYLIRHTATMSEAELRETYFEAEARLGRRLSESPRPHLVEADDAGAALDVFAVDLDRADAESLRRAAAPGAGHVALWLSGRDLWAAREPLERVVSARLAVDPHATLDVVLAPSGPFPLDLLDRLRACCEAATPSYGSRLLAFRGENAQRRLCVVVREGVVLAPDFLDALRDEVPVFVERTLGDAAARAADLGGELPGARIVGEFPPEGEGALRRLLAEADPEAVVFAGRAREAAWVRDAVGFSEVDE